MDLNPRHSRQRRGRTRALPSSRTPRPRRSPLRGLGLNLAATLRLAVLAVELAAVALLLSSPVFRIREVEVSGTAHLTRAEVLARAGLGAGRSIFLVDPVAAQNRLAQDPWVLTASVRTSLPQDVSVELTERQPYALLRIDNSAYLLDQLGYVLGPVAGTGPSLVVIGTASLPHASGQRALSGRLLQNLGRVRQAAPGSFGLTITDWQLGADYQLTAETAQGLRILFGQMATPDQLDTIDAKASALGAHISLAQGCYGYVNVENPRVIACGVKPSPSPSPAASPKPSPSPSPKH